MPSPIGGHDGAGSFRTGASVGETVVGALVAGALVGEPKTIGADDVGANVSATTGAKVEGANVVGEAVSGSVGANVGARDGANGQTFVGGSPKSLYDDEVVDGNGKKCLRQ